MDHAQLGGLDGGEASFFVGQRTHIESIDPILCMFSGYDLVCLFIRNQGISYGSL